jgi:hypothetical protein
MRPAMLAQLSAQGEASSYGNREYTLLCTLIPEELRGYGDVLPD